MFCIIKQVPAYNIMQNYTEGNHFFFISVFEELQLITKQHYIALEKLVQEQGLPILQQQEQKTQAQTRSRSRTSSYTQPSHPQYPAVSQYGYAPTMY